MQRGIGGSHTMLPRQSSNSASQSPTLGHSRGQDAVKSSKDRSPHQQRPTLSSSKKLVKEMFGLSTFGTETEKGGQSFTISDPAKEAEQTSLVSSAEGHEQLKQTTPQATKGRASSGKSGYLDKLHASVVDRFSPIIEESIPASSPHRNHLAMSPLLSGSQTASTESNQTVKGSAFPFSPGLQHVSTPAYPFPPTASVSGTPLGTPALHRPFTALSPTGNPPAINMLGERIWRDVISSDQLTPSIRNLEPSSDPFTRRPMADMLPNMYSIVLQLMAEPSLDGWWTQLTQCLKENYAAERITLAVPSDITDVENVPWAQMATYDAQEEDPLSKATLEKRSTQDSLRETDSQDGSVGANGTERSSFAARMGSMGFASSASFLSRPKLESRHSFHGFPQRARIGFADTLEKPMDWSRRPLAPRTGSHSILHGGRPVPDSLPRNTELSADLLKRHEASEELKSPLSEDPYATIKPASGRLLNVVQPLESEADPLLTTAGVIKVLDRTSAVVLTREYLDASQSVRQRTTQSGPGTTNEKRDRTTSEDQSSFDVLGVDKLRKDKYGSVQTASQSQSQTSRSSSNTSQTRREESKLYPTGHMIYEDYEQIPASPWSQSPAPSPAVQADPDLNPFFADVNLDEGAFAENPPVHNYTTERTIQAIGIDRASSIIHIPLIHPTMSQLKHPRLRTTRQMGNQKKPAEAKVLMNSSARGKRASLASSDKARRVPVAILSILSPTAPYPTELTASLNDLAPMIATSFYNARQHWNLQKEVIGLSRQHQGLGVRLESQAQRRAEATLSRAGLALGNNNERGSPSFGTSIASASEYSGMSMHSPRESLISGSIAGTPSWNNQESLSKTDLLHGQSPGVSRELFVNSSDDYFPPKFQQDIGGEKRSSPDLSGFNQPAQPMSPIISNNHASASVYRTSSRRKQGEPSSQMDVQNTTIVEETREKADTGTTAPANDSSQSRSYVNEIPFLEHSNISRTESSTERDVDLPHSSNDYLRSPRSHTTHQASILGSQHVERKHRRLHSNGAEFSATNPSLPHATTIVSPPRGDTRASQDVMYTFKDPTPTMLRLMIDNGATQQFIAECERGAIVWANSKFQSYRSESAEEIHQDPWNNIHHKDQPSFKKLWKKALRTGEQISHQVRLRRFDGQYRWFHIRILPLKDKHAVIKHWHGQAMDVHDLHVAELEATREREKAASEYKYRSLANSNPHSIFAASVPTGMTFANTQWLSYSGQTFEEALGFGFLEHVHPDDLLKCRFPELATQADSKSVNEKLSPPGSLTNQSSRSVSSERSGGSATTEKTLKAKTSSKDSPSNGVEAPNDLLRDLVKAGVIKCSKDGQGNLSVTTEMRLRSKSNEYRWHLVQGSLIDSVNFGQGDAQWFIACADISDQKHSEAQLKQACDTLEKEMSRKMKYLSSMSHEIRTPLNGILGNLQFLTNSGLDEFQSDWTFGAQKAAEGMHALINDILDLSKAEAKMLKLFYDWFSVRALIEEVVETLNAKAEQKGLEICYEVAEMVPPSIKGDVVRIRQILMNLVGNAIKFTYRGEIWIKCDIKETYSAKTPESELEWNEIYLRFSVQDTGTGFTDEEKKILFKPYSQIDNSNTRGNGGTGLGLILSKNMVELHGGKIDATSVPGKGSTFTFFARFTVQESISHSAVSSTSAPNEPTSISPGTLFPGQVLQGGFTESPGPSVLSAGMTLDSPALLSSGSSIPSVGSLSIGSLSHRPSVRSSASTVDNEANQVAMKLSLPQQTKTEADSTSENVDTETGDEITTGGRKPSSVSLAELKAFRPPMLSILIVCPQENTRRTTQEHIQRILPKSVPATITTRGNVEASQVMISGDNLSTFSHIVLQVSSAAEVLGFMSQILKSGLHPHTCLIIVTDQAQKAAITSSVSDHDYDRLATENRLRFLMKPAKPHKFAKIFDPDQENAQSNDDRTREEAREKQKLQKAAFKLFKEVLGNKGIRVLAVEDNKINMEVCISHSAPLQI